MIPLCSYSGLMADVELEYGASNHNLIVLGSYILLPAETFMFIDSRLKNYVQ